MLQIRVALGRMLAVAAMLPPGSPCVDICLVNPDTFGLAGDPVFAARVAGARLVAPLLTPTTVPDWVCTTPATVSGPGTLLPILA